MQQLKFFSNEIGKMSNLEDKRHRENMEESKINEIDGQINELEQKEE